jgi:hypothetical protein
VPQDTATGDYAASASSSALPAGAPCNHFIAVHFTCCVFGQPRRANKSIMSARRQSSTTSLAKYARATSPDTSPRNLDFCNAFWGLGDGGVDVLFARMRGAARTMEELRNFWKERYVARARLRLLSRRCTPAALTHSRTSPDRRSRKTMRDGSQN